MRALASLCAATLLAASLAGTAHSTMQDSDPQSTTGSRAEEILSQMTLDQKVGQLLWTHVYGASADDESLAAKNQAVFGPDVRTPAQAVAKFHLGGVLYFNWSGNLKSNPTDLQQVATLSNGLQAAAKASGAQVPLAITIDQEGGLVARVGSPATVFPGNMALGATGQVPLARAQGQVLGRELAALGINVDFAPTVDVNTNPANPVIGVRSISDDENLVAELGAAQITGMQQAGVSATAKHFPGHGDTEVDSHLGLPVVKYDRATLDRHLTPFKAAIAAEVDMIMTAHIIVEAIDPTMPGTLSKAVLTDLLRGELGYTGLITTDALDMEGAQLAVMTEEEKVRYRQLKDAEKAAKDQAAADPTYADQAQAASAEFKAFMAPIRGRVAVKALQAGSDILLNVYDAPAVINAVKAALADGTLSSERLDESVLRILKWKERRGILDHTPVDPAAAANVVGSQDDLAVARQIADSSVTLLRNNSHLLPLSAARTPKVLVAGSTYGNPEFFPPALEAAGFTVTFKSTAKIQPTDEEIAAMVEAAGQVDVVLLTTYNLSAAQERMVRQVAATGKPVIMVSTRNPYDLAKFEAEAFPQAAIATYSNKQVSAEAVVRVLVGQDPVGKLPVAVPKTDGSDVAYPRGWGLNYRDIERVAGADRYATAREVLASGDWADTALLASGTTFADAVAALPLAQALDAPVLLTGPTLDSELIPALQAHGITKVTIAGGEGSVPAAVADGLRQAGLQVERVAGPNRYATAVALAQATVDASPDIERVLVADGTNFPDALAAGTAAGPAQAVVLLSDGGRLPAAVETFLADRNLKLVGVGGAAATALQHPHGAPLDFEAVTGRDRYATAVQLAAKFLPQPRAVVVASGQDYADALSGGSLANDRQAALFFTPVTTLPGTVRSALADNPELRHVVVVGGQASVSEAVYAELAGILRR
ncbi:hypothetical protein EII12_01100 [Buchananella hordeovulneris]|nr:hypothetical protein EII12_01100 [Buchananella hordeovulneris]